MAFLCLALIAGACASPRHAGSAELPFAERPDPYAGRCCDAGSLLRFPLNVAPNVIVDTGVLLFDPIISPIVGHEPGSLWPIAILFSPVIGPWQGLRDAFYGRPFWDCWGIDEHRSHLEHHREDTAR